MGLCTGKNLANAVLYLARASLEVDVLVVGLSFNLSIFSCSPTAMTESKVGGKSCNFLKIFC